MDFVDLYCERVAPGLFGEPLNLFTNLAFFVVAWLGWRMARRRGVFGLEAGLLVALVAVFGTGSMAFHSFANTPTRWLDAVPIALFTIAYLWVWLRRVLRAPAAQAWGVTGLFALAAVGARLLVPVFGTSVIYAPALAMLAVIGVIHCGVARHRPLMLLAATGAFLVAVATRLIDLPLCPVVPFGTHFLWHLGAAVAIALALSALIPNLPARHDNTRQSPVDLAPHAPGV